MTNVVELFKKDLKYCSYYERGDDIGVAMLDKSIIMLPLNFKEVELTIKGESALFSREELAEFLHVAAKFLDSEEKYLPPVELVGLNYK